MSFPPLFQRKRVSYGCSSEIRIRSASAAILGLGSYSRFFKKSRFFVITPSLTAGGKWASGKKARNSGHQFISILTRDGLPLFK
jgi:hypothetical protein